MDYWFSVIASACELAANTVKELDDVGFVVIPGPVAPPQLSRLAAVYDAAVSSASDVVQDATAHYEGQVSACGPAGSVVIYNGSV